jgi:thiol-disulfide isomerase/thioredoxin
MKTVALLWLALLFLRLNLFAQLTINGTITAPDGSTPTLAHVSITPMSAFSMGKPSLETTNGKFRLTVEKAGYYKIWISAPNAKSIKIPTILTEKEKSVTLDVALTSIRLISPLTAATIGVKGSNLQPMTPEPDGTFSFVATATADTLAYQLYEVDIDGHSHNGTQSDYFVYDGGGDYYSVLRTKSGEQVKIIFDPQKMLQSPENAVPKVKWDKAPAYLSTLFELQERFDRELTNARVANQKAKAANPDLSNFSYDHSAFIKELETIQNTSSERLEVRQFAALTKSVLLPYNKQTKADAQSLLSLVPVSSPLWGLYSFVVNNTVFLLTQDGLELDRRAQLFTEFKEKNPDRSVQCEALFGLGKLARGNKEKLRSIYNELKTNYADLPMVKFALVDLNPDKAITIGNPVPDFEIKLLTGETVSRTSMLGKYYLIDFWAVWCGPCVGEMPKLHEAYEKYKGKKGFEILSLSFDRSPDDIEKFRATKFKMPWLHAFIENGFNHDLSKRFEVAGIPKPILVDDKGNIIAVEMDLRGTNLDNTLAKHLDTPKN